MGNQCLGRFRQQPTRPSNYEEPDLDGNATPRWGPGSGYPQSHGNSEAHQNGREFVSSPSKTIVRALHNFEGLEENDLSFAKDDFMEIDMIPGSADWIFACHLKTKKKGYIPSNYVVVHDTSPQSQDYWFDRDKKEANKKLLQAGNIQGTFLVRPASDNASYALSVRDVDKTTGDPCVKHYKIHCLDNDKGFYISAQRTFPTIFDIINYYKENSVGLCCKLTSVYSHTPPVVPFKELEISRDKVTLTTKLGAGCFGEVWKGIYLKVVDVAVKTLKNGTMSSEAFLNEAKIMHQLRHQKLVQILGVVSRDEPFFIITELMVHGALKDLLQSPAGKRLTFDTLIDMNCQIAEGMAYLESVSFIHRDLRTANILVGENNEVKVADFGLARILDSDDIYDASANTKFPIKWTAPEAAHERKFSVKSDVWSFGVLMFEVITFGKTPYPGMPGSQVLLKLERGYRMEKPQNGIFPVPQSYYDMMLKCWMKHPEERPTFASLYDFFNDYFVHIEPSYKEL